RPRHAVRGQRREGEAGAERHHEGGAGVIAVVVSPVRQRASLIFQLAETAVERYASHRNLPFYCARVLVHWMFSCTDAIVFGRAMPGPSFPPAATHPRPIAPAITPTSSAADAGVITTDSAYTTANSRNARANVPMMAPAASRTDACSNRWSSVRSSARAN